MNAVHYFINGWAGLVIGIALLSLPIARWASVEPMGSLEIVLGGLGMGALLLAIEDFLRVPVRREACPRCGEPLLEGA